MLDVLQADPGVFILTECLGLVFHYTLHSINRSFELELNSSTFLANEYEPCVAFYLPVIVSV